MGKWKEVKVADIANNIQYGYTGKTVVKGKIKYLRITDIQNQKVNWETVPISDISEEKEIEKYKLKINDILFARTGATVGKSFLIEELEPSIFASYLIRVQPKDRVFPKYLYLYFQSESYWKQIRAHEVGAAQPNVNGKKLGQIRFPLPPLPEQKRIVAKLDLLFADIDQAILLLEENIAYIHALIGSVLNEELSRFETKTEKIKNLLSEINSGFACNKSNEIPKGHVHLRTHNIDTSGNLNFDLMIKINPKKVDLKKNKIKKDDILFNNTNSKELVGKTALVDRDYDYGYSNHLTRIRLKENLILPEFFVNYMIDLHSQGYFLQICKKWIGQAGVNTSMLKDTEIKFPSIENQIILNKKIQSIKENCSSLLNQSNQKLTNLKALKSSLLDRAFMGEL